MSRSRDQAAWVSSDLPAVDAHALRRWRERTPDDSAILEEAWQEASEMTLDHPEYRHVDEARFHRPTRTVLLVEATVIRTILAASGPESTQLVRDAVENQFGIALTDS